MTREQLYRAFICPSCKAPFTPAQSHLPEAPGSNEGLHCFKCGKTWGWWRQHRVGGIVIPYGKPSLWMRMQDFYNHNITVWLNGYR